MQHKLGGLSKTLLKNLKQLYIFSEINAEILTECLQRVEELHCLKDELIFKKGDSFHRGIYFVLSGTVRMVDQNETLILKSGDAVGISTFLSKTMYTVTAYADSDCDLVFIDEPSFYSLMNKTPEFKEKFNKVIMERLNTLNRIVNHVHSLSAYQSVGSCMSAPLITLHNSKTVADAARMLTEHKVGAIVIMNRKHVLKGLLTARDLTQNYLTNAVVPAEEALAENYANANPLILPQEYPLVETLAEMLRTGQDYALVAKRNRPVGIISKADIIGLLSNGSDVFSATVSLANDLKALKKIVDSLPAIVEYMLNNTSLFRSLLPTLSSNHLMIQKKAFDLTKKAFKEKNGFELLAGKFCIMTLGTLARRDLTLALVQQHAIILHDSVGNDDVQMYKIFAKEYSDNLKQLGYSTNDLGLSLHNDAMVKRLSEWQEHISVSIHKSNETNIPMTRVLFDCDFFAGDEQLIWEFRDIISTTLKEKSLFFGRLISYQSTAKIPVTQFGSFITEKDGPYAGTIDLKKNAMDFLSYTTQTFSLYEDLLEVNTVRRLAHISRKNLIPESLVTEAVEAYEAIVDVILHEQLHQAQNGEETSYRVNPFELSMYSQEQLKRALHIVSQYFGAGLAYFK